MARLKLRESQIFAFPAVFPISRLDSSIERVQDEAEPASKWHPQSPAALKGGATQTGAELTGTTPLLPFFGQEILLYVFDVGEDLLAEGLGAGEFHFLAKSRKEADSHGACA